MPEGTTLELGGETNHPLATASLLGEGPEPSALALRVDGGWFRGRLRPRETGRWRWRLEPAPIAGAPRPPVVPPEPLEVAVVPDESPTVRILHPGGDTVADPRMAVPLVVDVRDDVGLERAEVVSWRASALGDVSSRVRVDLAVPSNADRALLRPLLDLRDRGFLPGDTAVYVVRAWDRHPDHPPGESDTLRVRLPDLGEAGRRAAERSREVVEEAEAIRASAESLERRAREAGRRVRPPGASPAGGEARAGGEGTEELGFEATEEGRRVLEAGRRLEERLASLEERVDRLAAELSGSLLGDPEVRSQLRRLRELYRELRESGLGELLRELERALRELDARAVGGELGALAEEARELRERVERSAGVMEWAALEQAVSTSREDAERLARLQREVAESAGIDSAWADREAELAREADVLAARLDSLRDRLAGEGLAAAADSADAAREGAAAAGREMSRAADAARAAPEPRPDSEAGAATDPAGERAGAGKRTAAGASAARGSAAGDAGRRSAYRAAREMQTAASSLGAAGRSLAREWKGEALAAVERARTEVLELAREQAEIARRLYEGEASDADWQGRQTAIRQGLERLGSSLSEAGRKTALLDPSTWTEAARAARQVDRVLGEDGGEPGRRRPLRGDVDAIAETLNSLARRLLESEVAIRSGTSGTGVEEALERMGELARRQEGLSQRGGSLLSPGRAGRGLEQRLRRLAREQAAVARELAEVEPRPGMVGRPEALAEEAERLAERLGRGSLDLETVERQRRLFQRMLDAGRSLERDARDPERREARTAGPVPGAEPSGDPVPPREARHPYPSESELRGLPIDVRRMVLDYFDRLRAVPPTSPAPRDDAEGGGA